MLLSIFWWRHQKKKELLSFLVPLPVLCFVTRNTVTRKQFYRKKQCAKILWLWLRKGKLQNLNSRAECWLLKLPHWVKSVCVRSYSGMHIPAFGLNTERYFVSLRIRQNTGKCRPESLRIRTLFTQCQLTYCIWSINRHLWKWEFPISKGMFKKSQSDHEVTKVNISS